MPPLACAAMAVITFIVVSLYFILLAMLRDPQGLRRLTSQSHMAQTGHTAETMRKTTEALRAPFAEENRQLNELSNLVHNLSSSNTPGDPQQNLPKK